MSNGRGGAYSQQHAVARSRTSACAVSLQLCHCRSNALNTAPCVHLVAFMTTVRAALQIQLANARTRPVVFGNRLLLMMSEVSLGQGWVAVPGSTPSRSRPRWQPSIRHLPFNCSLRCALLASQGRLPKRPSPPHSSASCP